jgi:hypothetical protein
MKIAKTKYNRIAQYSRNVISHCKGGHGKCLEMFLADHYNFPQYDQYKSKVDFPKEIVAQGNVPAEWVADWEVKYYNINSSTIMLGDLERKMQCLKNGLVLVVGFYDGTPDNLVDIKFIKIKANNSLLQHYNEWKKLARFVKDRNNPIEETRERVKQANASSTSHFFINNISRKSRWSESQGKMIGEARAVSLAIYAKNLSKLAS